MKKGLVNSEKLTVSFGGKNPFEAKLHKVPDYIISYKETYGSGGWVEGRRITQETILNTYLVIKDSICIGVVFNPYADCLGIKSEVYPIGVIPHKYLSGKETIEIEIKKFNNL